MELVSKRVLTVQSSDITSLVSVADYKYDDESNYGNGIYTQVADDVSNNWNVLVNYLTS